MNNLSMIVACEENRGIGYQQKMPWHVPEDLKWFKEKTLDKSIIMGRNTFESILSYSGKLLPRRHHIVLSRNIAKLTEGVDYYRDKEPLVSAIRANPAKEYMVVGGAQIYKEFMPLVDTVYLTRIKASHQCDTYLEADFTDFSMVSCDSTEMCDFMILKRNKT